MKGNIDRRMTQLLHAHANWNGTRLLCEVGIFISRFINVVGDKLHVKAIDKQLTFKICLHFVNHLCNHEGVGASGERNTHPFKYASHDIAIVNSQSTYLQRASINYEQKKGRLRNNFSSKGTNHFDLSHPTSQ